jgi:hypothetical protein
MTKFEWQITAYGLTTFFVGVILGIIVGKSS